MLIFQKITIFWGFFCNVIRQREYYFLSKIAQLSLIFFRIKSSYTFDIFQLTFLLLETFTKSLSITLKSTIFSLHIYSKKRSKKYHWKKYQNLLQNEIFLPFIFVKRRKTECYTKKSLFYILILQISIERGKK